MKQSAIGNRLAFVLRTSTSERAQFRTASG
jgi:hypothetical protein